MPDIQNEERSYAWPSVIPPSISVTGGSSRTVELWVASLPFVMSQRACVWDPAFTGVHFKKRSASWSASWKPFHHHDKLQTWINVECFACQFCFCFWSCDFLFYFETIPPSCVSQPALALCVSHHVWFVFPVMNSITLCIKLLASPCPTLTQLVCIAESQEL